MTQFATLEDVELTKAWPHEAHDFTPWLAENLDRLSDVLGIQLALEGREVAVERFAADILARNLLDDSLVLIENQFQQSDHSHLGQIMTYLAGLEAQTVVWIAPRFREPHLSAIRWLNEHTEEPFAFFAVELRVVRIGDSPMVPLFDVVERPNDWERSIKTKSRDTAATSEPGQFRADFWAFHRKRHAGRGDPTEPYRHPNQWQEIPDLPILISYFVGKRSVGVFLRKTWSGELEETYQALLPNRTELETLLNTQMGEGRYLFQNTLDLDMTDRNNWPRASDWLEAEVKRYEGALAHLGGDNN